MKTYEMIVLADVDGKVYKTQDMHYQKDEGFYGVWKDGHREWKSSAFNSTNGLNTFIHFDGWKEEI